MLVFQSFRVKGKNNGQLLGLEMVSRSKHLGKWELIFISGVGEVVRGR